LRSGRIGGGWAGGRARKREVARSVFGGDRGIREDEKNIESGGLLKVLLMFLSPEPTFPITYITPHLVIQSSLHIHVSTRRSPASPPDPALCSQGKVPLVMRS
jgi:hypothetical protein